MVKKVVLLFVSVCVWMCSSAQELNYDHMDELLSDPTLADTVRVQMLDKLAYDYSNRNAYLAEKYGSEALDLSKKIDYRKGLVKSYRVLGISMLNQSRYPEALNDFQSALKLAETLEDPTVRASIFSDLAAFYKVLKDYPSSLQYCNQAVAIYRKQEDNAHALEVYGKISQLFQAMGQLDKAETLAMDVLRTAEVQKNQASMADSYQNLGDIFQERGETDKARFWFRKSAEQYGMLKDEQSRINPILKLGELYFTRENPVEARRYLLETVQRSISTGSPRHQLEAYRLLSSVDSMTGNMAGALQYFQRYAFMRDSLESVAKHLAVEKIKSSFDLENKQKSIDNLLVVKNKQEVSIKNQNTVIVTFFILIMLIVCMCLVLNYYYRQKKKINLELHSQKEELVSLNSVKDRLFSVISHDLRSPLANLEALLGLMENGDLSTEEVLMLASQLTHNVQDTSNMLDNLLQWSRSQMQGQTPKKQKADLHLLVNDIIHFFRQQAEKKAINIKLHSSENCVTLTDVEMMKLVIRNLLGNAIKFTPTGGMIEIEIRTSFETIQVSVKDSGLGISELNKEKLFGGDTISTTGTQDEKGTGLGLMLCKDFVEKNGGRIWVESELGKGSVFSFSLPYIREQPKTKSGFRARVY